jgi:methionyl aminopeptidase
VVEIKTLKEINAMRLVGRMAAATLALVESRIRIGMTTDEIDEIVRTDTLRRGAVPAPLNYKGFPKSCCTSVNEVACHGVPGKRKLQNGDIINVDVTTLFGGFHGDTSATFYVGDPSKDAIHVTETARQALQFGLEQVRPSMRIGDIGSAIQSYVESRNCNVVRDFVGHGIGRIFHDDPKVPHWGAAGTGVRLHAGMTFTIEPIVSLGLSETRVDENDGWTASTIDGSWTAQFEHTLLVTADGYEVLTII